jgi:hypothetical protein
MLKCSVYQIGAMVTPLLLYHHCYKAVSCDNLPHSLPDISDTICA